MDSFWSATVEFLNKIDRKWPKVVPSEMLEGVLGATPYPGEGAGRNTVIALHKGRLSDVDSHFLASCILFSQPIFSNEVFVIFGPPGTGLPVARGPNVESLVAALGAQMTSTTAVERKLGRQTIYLGHETLMTTLSSGEKIYLDANDISLTPHIALDGIWEPWITKAFLNAIKPGMHFVDIGANCGYYTLLASSAVGRTGSVVAIDANPRMTELLGKSISVNGFLERARVVNAAVLDSERTIKFAVPKKYMGSATYVRDGNEHDFSASYGDTCDIIKVQAKPLDALLGDKRVDLMKIDAEGAEPLIFKGSLGLLQKMEKVKIFLEFVPAFFSEFISGAEFLDLIETAGFSISVVDRSGVPQRLPRDRVLAESYTDLLLEKA